MTYLDFLPQVLGESQADRVPVFGGLIEKNRVAAYLQNKGYKYVLSGSYWDPTKVTGIADENDNLFSDFDEFHLYIYERTLFNTLRGIIEDKQLYTGAERLNKMSLNLDYRLSQIKKQTPETQPLFVFAHFLMPHEPNVRSETCEPLTLDEIRAQTTEQGYLKETACANEIMKALTEKIKARPDRPAVIIFQSDEGPYLPSSYFNKNGQLVPAEKDSYLIHGAVLNALYLPDKNNPQLSANYEQLGLHQASSPVNTFRAIFNYYFGAQLPLLEDKLYFSNNDERYPYQYFEVIP